MNQQPLTSAQKALKPVAPVMIDYNQNAGNQRVTVISSLQLLRQSAYAAAKVFSGTDVHIAEFGCSHGSNSLAPVTAMIQAFEEFLNKKATFLVYHEDLPSNDFNQLITLVETSPDSYKVRNRDDGSVDKRPNIFTAVVGKSFFEPCFPPAHLDSAFCFNAVHWLSALPSAPLPRTFIYLPERTQNQQHRDEWSGHAHEDLVNFLRLRAAEIKPGGTMVLSAVGRPGEEEDTPADRRVGARLVNALLDYMIANGIVSDVEAAVMTLPLYHRTPSEFQRALDETAGLFSVLHTQFTRHHDGIYNRVAAGDITRENGAREAAKLTMATFQSTLHAAFRALGRSDATVSSDIARIKNGMQQFFEREEQDGWFVGIWTVILQRL